MDDPTLPGTEAAWRLLLIADNATRAERFAGLLLSQPSWVTTCAGSLEEAIAAEMLAAHHAAVLDATEAAGAGMAGRLRDLLPGLPLVVLLPGEGDECEELEWLRLGAAEVLRDGASTAEALPRAIRSAIARGAGAMSIRESEELLRAATEHARVGIVLLDAERRYLFANAAYHTILGLGPAPIVGRPVSEVLGDVYEQQIRSRLDRAFAGERVAFELHRGPAIGEDPARYYSVTYERRTDPQGSPRVVVVIYDITERKQAEEVREHLAAIVRSSDDAIIGKGLDGVITSWNPAAERLFGFPEQETLGRPLAELLVPAERQPEEAGTMARLAAGEPVIHLDTVRTRKDGTPVDLSVTISPVRDGSGRIIGCSEVARDVTERRRAEAALRIREAHAQALLRLSRRLERADSHSDILVAAREAVLETIGMRRVWLYQLSSDGDYLDLILEEEGDEPLEQRGEGRHLRIAGDSMLEEIVAAAEVVVVEDARTDPRTNKEIVAALGNRTIVNVPIILAGKRLGALGTGSFGEEGVRPLSPEEREFLAALGSHVAAVLDRVTSAVERERAEAALRESEARFRQLAESLPQPVWTCNAEGACDYLSQRWTEYTGVPCEAQLGVAWVEQVHPDDRNAMIAAWRAALAAGAAFRCEFRLRRHDGEYRWFDTRAAPVRDASGRTVKWVGSNTDVEDGKQAVAEREKLARLIEHSHDFIGTADLDGRVTYLNAGGRRMIGFDLERDPSELQLTDYVPERWQELLWRTVLPTALETGLWEGEMQLSHLVTGAPVDVFRSTFLIRDPHTGEPAGYASVTRDITGQKRAEDALRLFRRLVDQSSDAFEVIDPATGAFLDVNEHGCAAMGYTREEMLTLTVFDVDPTVSRSGWPEWMAGLQQARNVTIQGSHRRKDGTSFPVEVSVGWVELDREYIVSVARDVSERRHLEEQVRQSQKMEAIGQLAAGVAHDFNNLLCVIAGYAELCQMDLPEGAPERKMLGEILTAGERASGLTRQLLAFSRQQVLAPRVLDLNGVIADTENMLRRLIGEDILLTTITAPDLHLVKVDPGQMNQVILNLAVNARDAMPQGGRLTLETRNVERATLDPEGDSGGTERAVLLCVTDTGCGMTPEVRERIFEPFFTTKGVGMGTGLGLSVVHGIVQQSGGKIAVESGPGNGTSFRIVLPAAAERVHDPKPEPERRPASGTETILLVEDDDLVRGFAADALRPFGYRILLASGGDEALRIAAEHPGPIHLLVTDVVMPRMNGRELAQTLQARQASLKVLFVSGYTDDAVVRHGVRQAEAAFLQKPVSPNALAGKIRELLDHP
jgi:PAS domain S-box-containing protein